MTDTNDPILDALYSEMQDVSAGLLIQGYTLVMTYLDGDGDDAWGKRTMDGQNVLTTAAHVRVLNEDVGMEVRSVLGDAK